MGVNGVFGEWREFRFGNPRGAVATGACGGFGFCWRGCGALGSLVVHSPNLDGGDFSVKVVRHMGGSLSCGKVRAGALGERRVRVRGDDH